MNVNDYTDLFCNDDLIILYISKYLMFVRFKGTKCDRKWEKTETNLWQFRSIDGNPCWFFWNLQKYTCNVYLKLYKPYTP